MIAKNKQMARTRVFLDHGFSQRGQGVERLTHVRGHRAEMNPHRGRQAQHHSRPARRSASITCDSKLTSTPEGTRMVAPPGKEPTFVDPAFLQNLQAF